MVQYGLNLLLWTTAVDEKFFPHLEKIKGWGYDGVELPIFDMDPATFRQVGAKLDELGLQRTAVTICTPDANPISPNAAIRQAALTRLKTAIDMCATAGATLLCGPMHSALGEFSGRGRTLDEWNCGKAILSQAADYAQQHKVMLALEYLNRFECYFLTCAEDTARFCWEVNHPHLTMMWDTFHAHIEEKSVSAGIRSCVPKLAHVHISENDRSTPGKGQVPWMDTFTTLDEVRYDGWLVIEAFGLALPTLAAATKIWRRMFTTEEQLARDGLAFMKSMVKHSFKA